MKNTGFTTIELLTVIAIILTLIGIGVPAYNSWRNRSETAKAKAVIQQLEMALEMYKTENGVYPQQRTDLNSSGALTGYLAQYMKFDPDELDPSNNLLDPWGVQYRVYVDDDGDGLTGPAGFGHNRNSCYIHSSGPNKNFGDADDIDNYNS